jgi:N-acetylneuraminic acid mutarotase
MNTPRRSFFMVRLTSGKVLVGGGIRDKSTSLNSAEIYDPATRTFSSVPDMPGSNRAGANAILLSNGKVLVAGGASGSELWKSAIIFDVTTNSWSSVSSQMQTEHYLNAAIVTLNDGRVLIAGGQTVGGESVSKTDIFDPTTNTFSAGPELSQPRQGLTAHVLADGKVVFIGGGAYETTSNTVDVYDPVTSQIIRQFNTMSYSRYEHSSALLLDGRVLIVGAFASAIGEIFTQ